MAKRLTPIERAIAGEPQDRRERYEAALKRRGLAYVKVLVPVEQAPRVRELARKLVADHDDVAGQRNVGPNDD